MWKSEILLVEDNPITRRIFQSTLESSGYRVRLAGSGGEALKALEVSLPELLLLDLHLPDMDGMELTRRVRTVSGGEAIPVILISGFLSLLEERAALDAGFSAVMFKPCDPHRLVSTIRTYLPTKRRSREQVGAGVRLLLVDDDPVSLKLQSIQLEAVGFQVRTESDPRKVVAIALDAPPHVIVSDVLMPDMDGFQLCHQVRQEPLLNSVPILLVSSEYFEEADRVLAARAGAYKLLKRTPQAEDLVPHIVETLDAAASGRSISKTEPIQIEHGQRVIHQLKRQLALNQSLILQSSLQAAELSVLGAASTALSSGGDLNTTILDVLTACQDCFGLSRMALYLKHRDEALSLHSAIGFSHFSERVAQEFFGFQEVFHSVMDGKSVRAIPNPEISPDVSKAMLEAAGVSSALMAPLWVKNDCLGILFLGAVDVDLSRAEILSFARTLGSQISQAFALAFAFEQLSASEQKTRSILEEASCGILLVTPQGRILEANRKAEEFLSHSGEEVFGGLVQRHTVEEEQILMEGRLRRWTAGRGSEEVEIRLRGPGGKPLEFDAAARAITIDGTPRVLLILNDTRAARELRRRTSLNEKLATLGTLAAGIAHEINNPLTFLMHSLEILSQRISDATNGEQSDSALLIGRMEEGLDRIRRIVAGIKGFGRVDEEEVRPFQIGGVLESAIAMTSHLFQHQARLEVEVDPFLPDVVGHPGKIQQVIINLLANASQALRTDRSDENLVKIWATHSDGWVRVRVEDNGKGIPAEALPRIFEPYFTTKKAGEGTGLGLSLCHEIIQQHGGSIQVQSQVGKGTRFEVCLQPLLSLPESATEPEMMPRILLIDDDANLLASLTRNLRKRYRVTSAQGGLEALGVLGREEDSFDVILTDLAMPKCSGMDLYSYLKEKRPGAEARVVFMTGGAFREAERAFLESIPNQKISKPFPIQILEHILDTQLRSRP